MTELMACRRPTDPVGGDTASQQEVEANTDQSDSGLRKSTRSPAGALIARYPVDAGAVLPEAGRGGAPTGGRLFA